MNPNPNPNEPQTRDNDGLHKRRGIWYYCLIVNGQRRFFSTKTRSWHEARKTRANAIKAQLENRLPTDAAKQRFEVLLRQVLGDRKPHLCESTIRLERERSAPLLKHFSGRRVSEIDSAAIRSYQTTRAKQVSTRTVNLETKLLRQILKAAKIWGILADDFKPLREDRRGPGRALEEDQEHLLFDTARSNPRWDAAFYAAMIAANTTMRGCEIKGLRIADVNLVDLELIVRRSKTDAGKFRRIPLNSAAMWAFARLLERATALGSLTAEHFLFPRFLYRETKTAGHATGYDPTRPQKTWRSAWRALVKETARRAGREAARGAVESRRGWRAGVAAWKRAAARFRGLRFHDLRHTAITKLAESEASDQTIMAIAGHLDRSMLEHYSHIRAAAKRKAVEAIRSYIPEEMPVAITKSVQ
jgi:integrase